MNREQKINMIKDIAAGVPLLFIQIKQKNPILYKNEGEDIHYIKGLDCQITEAERLKYLPDAIIFENVSKQFVYTVGAEGAFI